MFVCLWVSGLGVIAILIIVSVLTYPESSADFDRKCNFLRFCRLHYPFDKFIATI